MNTNKTNEGTITCLNCNESMASNLKFCTECGTRLVVNESSPDPSSDPSVDTHSAQAPLRTFGGRETILGGSAGASGAESLLNEGDMFADRYEIVEQIGRGGMGVVYKAKDKVADRTIALKLINPAFASNDAEFARLKQEGLTARDIRHKNVVAVYDIGQDNGQPFITMEYLEGRSLRDWHRDFQKSSPVPVRLASQAIVQILEGLEAAHEKGVIHRDLKPENVMIVNESEGKFGVKILDFGIARTTENDSQANHAMGTQGYMAPEQLTSPDLAGPSADLYSVSVMFYELLTDVVPMGRWQPPSKGRSDVPRRLDALIEKGLSNRPLNRVQTAQNYLLELRQAAPMTEPMVTAEVVSPLPQYSSKANQPQSITPETNTTVKWIGIGAAIAIGLLMLVCGLGAIIDLVDEPSPPEVSPPASIVGNWSGTLSGLNGQRVGFYYSFNEDGTFRYKDGYRTGTEQSGWWDLSGNQIRFDTHVNRIYFSYYCEDDRLELKGNNVNLRAHRVDTFGEDYFSD